MGRRGMGRRAHKMEEKGQRMDGVSFGKRQAGRRGQPFPAELTETVRGFGGGLARILREHPSRRSSRRGSARVLRRRACQKPRLRVTQRKATPHGRSLRSAKLFHATDRGPISPTQPPDPLGAPRGRFAAFSSCSACAAGGSSVASPGSCRSGPGIGYRRRPASSARPSPGTACPWGGERGKRGREQTTCWSCGPRQ